MCVMCMHLFNSAHRMFFTNAQNSMSATSPHEAID